MRSYMWTLVTSGGGTQHYMPVWANRNEARWNEFWMFDVLFCLLWWTQKIDRQANTMIGKSILRKNQVYPPSVNWLRRRHTGSQQKREGQYTVPTGYTLLRHLSTTTQFFGRKYDEANVGQTSENGHQTYFFLISSVFRCGAKCSSTIEWFCHMKIY